MTKSDGATAMRVGIYSSLFFAILLCIPHGLATGATATAPATQPASYEREIAAFEREDAIHPPPQNANLFIGSSSIRLWASLSEDFRGTPTIRRGFGGSAIADSTRFAPRIVIPYHPRRIFLYAGENDLAAGRSPQRVLADFKAFVAAVRAGLPTTDIYFISIKPSPLRVKLLDNVREANALVEAFCPSAAHVHYIDIFTQMLDADGRPRPELFRADHLHMNAKGYAIWISKITPLLRQPPSTRP